ncbi:acetate kinase [Rhinocladiella mackenziei CBS 650.93]|uniref:Probable acetate kinase n=1 Tax=Rhinocladiella mackenziei CBS 650.93 TaxID=1442369 RepID=A0A0D2ITC7_9EURO|nr:acetate kinase [Rhinocladiella mackenziei CBS 650.93]KIX09309.1 acetate kinase [Rhinocladiella mackenziei CBS 650.93]
MANIILSINAGSSSLKTTLFIEEDERQLRRLGSAEVSSLNAPPAKLKYSRGSYKATSELSEVHDHKDAFQSVLHSFLSDTEIPELSAKEDIHYATHRVVQGGEEFNELTLITRETFEKINKLSDLAPLHNASAVSLMIACHDHLPKVTNVACFDSGFHHTMPDYVKCYAIDQSIAQEKGLRKYGFHGLSYKYMTRRVAEYLGKPESETSLIALHLGSGASACAIKNGQSVDTTMGLTPVSGLPGGTRSGDIDPSLVFHYTSDASALSPNSTKDLHISTAEEILNKQSGWKALTGTTDFSQIADPHAPDTHKLAFNIFVDRLIGYIGNYFVKLGGKVDALVFAGGIGERSAYLRQVVTEKVSCLGFTLDDDKNQNAAGGEDVVDIGKSDKIRTIICETDEDYEMAYNCVLHPK